MSIMDSQFLYSLRKNIYDKLKIEEVILRMQVTSTYSKKIIKLNWITYACIIQLCSN